MASCRPLCHRGIGMCVCVRVWGRSVHLHKWLIWLFMERDRTQATVEMNKRQFNSRWTYLNDTRAYDGAQKWPVFSFKQPKSVVSFQPPENGQEVSLFNAICSFVSVWSARKVNSGRIIVLMQIISSTKSYISILPSSQLCAGKLPRAFSHNAKRKKKCSPELLLRPKPIDI